MSHPVFASFRLNSLELKNRTIKSATYEGMCENNAPSEKMVQWHRSIARGGVAMNTLAYCAVSEAGATFKDQIIISKKNAARLKAFSDKIHHAGGKASAQLAHCGFFSKNNRLKSAPLSPSRSFNKLGLFSGLSFSKEMTIAEIDQTIDDFANAAQIMKDCGFDAVEVHSGHGYLLSQFLSPAFNKRRDEYGGTLEKRLRFPTEVIQAIRNMVGPSFPILVKMNLEDGFKGGSSIEDSMHIASTFEKAGADALVLSGGFTSVNAFYLLRGDIPLKQMIRIEKNWFQRLALMVFGPFLIRKIRFEKTFFLKMAKLVRSKVKIPLVYVGGVTSLKDIENVLNEGFDLIALGRPLVHDPNFIKKLKSGEVTKTACTYCNQCVAEVGRNGIRCVLTD